MQVGAYACGDVMGRSSTDDSVCANVQGGPKSCTFPPSQCRYSATMSVAETRNDSVAGTANRAPPDVAESSDVTMRPSSLDDTSTVTTTHTHTHTHTRLTALCPGLPR